MWKLPHHLPHTVYKLKEDWGSVSILVPVVTMTNALSKFMAKTKPFFLYEDHETLQCAVMPIQQQHG